MNDGAIMIPMNRDEVRADEGKGARRALLEAVRLERAEVVCCGKGNSIS